MVIALLFVAVFLVLGIRWLLRDKTAMGARGSLMISLTQDDLGEVEAKLKGFLGEQLKGLSLQSMSVVDGRVNLQYQYKQQPDLDWTLFANDLNRIAAPATVEIFVG